MRIFQSTAGCRVLAAVLLASWLAAAPALAAGKRMSESEIETVFSGMTLDGIYRDGTFFTETYKDDGAIRYHDADGADSGEWSVEDGKFCTFYETDQGACFFVEREGENCFSFFAPEETGADNPPPQLDWTSRGWDTSKPSTCPTEPQIQL